MIPVITSSNDPAFSRAPTFSPNLAAVVVVTAACTTAWFPGYEPLTGSRPATIWL